MRMRDQVREKLKKTKHENEEEEDPKIKEQSERRLVHKRYKRGRFSPSSDEGLKLESTSVSTRMFTVTTYSRHA